MNTEEFLNEHFKEINLAKDKISNLINEECIELIEHFKARIKATDSIIQKLHKKGLEPTVKNALSNLNDIVGVRIICRFLADVYEYTNILEKHETITHINSKDYISHPKENGYRSYHIILEIDVDGVSVPLEIQIRTISQDSWASLEHKMKYKKEIKKVNIIKDELKRLSDEMASTDVCMQTLREVITGM